MSYIGSTPTTQSFISGTDYFNGDGSTTAFTLSRSVVSVNDIEVVINNVVQQPNTAYTISGTTITFTSAPSSGTSNIYVRYLSTTTQSITPSQNTVSYNTLNSDTQSKLGISFKNRIINGAMVIDQRNAGASVSALSSGVYPVDRFQVYCTTTGLTGTAQQVSTAPTGFVNSLKFTTGTGATSGSTERAQIQQCIEGYNTADLQWGTANAKTVTLSFWAQSSKTGQFGGSVQNYASDRSYPFSYTISAANTWTQVSITIPGDQSGTWLTTNSGGICLNFDLGMGSTLQGTANTWAGVNYRGATGDTSVVATSGATFYLTGVQFEVGTQATTFDYRSITQETLLCQRYFWRFSATTSGNYVSVGSGVMMTTTTAQCYLKYPTTMRASPTLSIYTVGGMYANTGDQAAVSAINGYYAGIDSARVDLTTSSTVARSGVMWWLGDSNASYVQGTAEL